MRGSVRQQRYTGVKTLTKEASDQEQSCHTRPESFPQDKKLAYTYHTYHASINCLGSARASDSNSGTLRSWGHLSFLYYMVKTGPMLRIFGSKIISLTFLDILNANLSEIETLKPHL